MNYKLEEMTKSEFNRVISGKSLKERSEITQQWNKLKRRLRNEKSKN